MSPGAAWARRLGGLSFVLLATVALSHRYGLVGTPELPVLAAVALALAALGLLIGLVAFRRYWIFGDRGGPDIFWGFFWCLATAVPLAVFGWWYLAYPPLADISTDAETPPTMTKASGLRAPDMNPIGPPTPDSLVAQAENYPLIKGRRYEQPIDRVLMAVDGIIQRREWTVTGTTDAVGMTFETTIEAEALSPILSVPADVSIRLTDEGTSTFVDMRSASRYWRHDFGDNAARIVNFLTELDADMSAQTGVAPVGSQPPEDDAPTVEIPDEAPAPTQAPTQ
jgi:hypothetical protein